MSSNHDDGHNSEHANPPIDSEEITSSSSSDEEDELTAEDAQMFFEKATNISVLASPRALNPNILSTTSHRSNPHWWPFAQQISFADGPVDLCFTNHRISYRNIVLPLKDLALPPRHAVSKEYLSAMARDIMESGELKPYHGFITVRKRLLSPPGSVSEIYEVADGYPLMFAFDDLLAMGNIESIGKLPFVLAQLWVGSTPAVTDARLDQVQVHLPFESVSMPVESMLDTVYANQLAKWIQERPATPLSTLGRLIVLQVGSGKFQVQQGMPLFAAIQKVKHLLNGDNTLVSATVVKLLPKSSYRRDCDR